MTMSRLQFVPTDKRDVNKRKRSLRAYVKARRAECVNRDGKERWLVDNFKAAYERIFCESIGAGTRRTFFVYKSFSSEAPTDKLIELLFVCGHTVLAPRVEGDGLIAVKIERGSVEYTRSAFGILEPIGEAYQGEIDVAIVPFLAVDTKGNRLGYGGGYYDRFLKDNAAIKRIAYGFDFQVLKEVPQENGDEKMEWIVTDERVLQVR